MNDIRTALEQALDLISACRQLLYIEQLSAGSPARLSALNLIGLYLGAAQQALRGAADIARRI